MELNGFNSDNYRYFYLNNSQNWTRVRHFSYGVLKQDDIIKLSNADLIERLFSSNYWNHIGENIYPHSVTQYPTNKPFDLLQYLYMQKPITFKWDGVLYFSYDYGEFAYINNWMSQKMNSYNLSKRIFANGTIKEENEVELNLIRDEEIFQIKTSVPSLEEEISKEIGTNTGQLPQKFQNKAFRLKNIVKFELEYRKDETWILTDSSVSLGVFNQDFIRLLANSMEILDEEKKKIFEEEYQDNIPNSTRRYYKVKNGITVDNIFQIMSESSLECFDRGFDSLIVRKNAENVGICNLNRDNFRSDGTIKYFYVDYSDSFNDRIAEQEILKIADRLPQQQALKIEQKNSMAKKEKKDLDEAIEYIDKHKQTCKKFCRRNCATPIDFVENEKKQLIARLLKAIQKRLELL